jgi:hypothetical protein
VNAAEKSAMKQFQMRRQPLNSNVCPFCPLEFWAMSNIQTASSLGLSKNFQQLIHLTSLKNSATSYIYILAWRSYLRQLQTNPLVTKVSEVQHSFEYLLNL